MSRARDVARSTHRAPSTARAAMNDSAHRRVAATLRHVLGGDDAGAVAVGGALSRAPTGSPARAPLLTPADVPALTRMLDHDNHDMRDNMKRFMKSDLYLPVRRAASLPRPTDCCFRADRGCRASATTCRSAWSASWRWSVCRRFARSVSFRCAPGVAGARRGLAVTLSWRRVRSPRAPRAVWRLSPREGRRRAPGARVRRGSLRGRGPQLQGAGARDSASRPRALLFARCATSTPTTRTASSRRTRWRASATAGARPRPRATPAPRKRSRTALTLANRARPS